MKVMKVSVICIMSLLIVSCGSPENIELEIGKTYRINVGEKNAYFEIINGEDEMSLGLIRGDKFLLGSYLSNSSFELSFKSEDAGTVTTVYDKNGDGIPDYRLIKNRNTGEVSKEFPSEINWGQR